MSTIMEALKVAALLCQTELGTTTSTSKVEAKRLECLSYYVACGCTSPLVKLHSLSGNLVCNTEEMPSKLAACLLERSLAKRSGSKPSTP